MNNFTSIVIAVCFFTFNVSFSQAPLGNGSDGDLIVNNGETYLVDETRSAITGANPDGSLTLSVENGQGFSAGDEVLIITITDPDTNMMDNQVGKYEFNHVLSATDASLTLARATKNPYSDQDGMKHQVVKVPNFGNVTVAGTLTCSAWDGKSGGVLAFRSNGTITVNGTGVIHANGKGYRGGWQFGSSNGGGQGGESYIGIGGKGGDYQARNAMIGGGGGGAGYNEDAGAAGLAGGGGGSAVYIGGKGSMYRGGAGGGGGGHSGSGGGGGYGTPGKGGSNHQNDGRAEDGGIETSGDGGVHPTGSGGGGGGTFGHENLTKLYFGAGGGASGKHGCCTPTGIGGNGGGLVFISAKYIQNDGVIQSRGANGGNYSSYSGGGGGGAGGSVYLQAVDIANTNAINANGGTGGNGYYSASKGGNGGNGRLRFDYHVFNNSGNYDTTAYDIEPFKNISTVFQPNTSDDSGPYTIQAYIFDTDNNPVTNADLHYSLNGGGYNMVAMTDQGGGLYAANIPGQPKNTVIRYYITAGSVTDSYQDPLAAPSVTHRFEIKGTPPGSLKAIDKENSTVSLHWETPTDISNLLDYSVYQSETKNFIPGPGNLLAQNVTDTTYLDNSAIQDGHTYFYKVAARFNIGGTQYLEFSPETSVRVNDSTLTTITGQVLLEDATNHKDIIITFDPISPSAVFAQANTNIQGLFEISITSGVYNIYYEKAGFQTYPIKNNITLVDDLDLGKSTLIDLGTPVVGNVSGVWDGIYSVNNDITVPNGDTLIIKPGSKIRFTGNYNIFVNGYLDVQGAQTDTVVFTSAPADQKLARGQWMGIDFNDASDDNSRIRYALIQYAAVGIYWNNAKAAVEYTEIHNSSSHGMQLDGNASDVPASNVYVHHSSSHGILVDDANPDFHEVHSHHNGSYGAYWRDYAYGSITKSTFNNNSSHGIWFLNWASPRVDSCEFNNNKSWGVRVDYAHPSFYHSIFNSNHEYGLCFNHDNSTWITPVVDNCEFEDNTSYGLYLRRSLTDAARVMNSTFKRNGNAGIGIWYRGNAEISNNIITDNYGHGIAIAGNNENNPNIHHNVIAYNTNDGIYKSDNNGSPTIKYNTIYANGGDGIELNNNNNTETITNNIIVNNDAWGVNGNSNIETFQYNNIYNNGDGALINTSNYPAQTWVFNSVNSNGIPSDIFGNIRQEPGLKLSNNYDFTLAFASVCIDAGDDKITDPDDTPTDLGAIYRDLGNPRDIWITGFDEQSVSLSWDNVASEDSLQSYKVYYKLNTAPTFGTTINTSDTFITVSGLTNNVLYDFAVSGVYPNYESVLSSVVSEMPGAPHANFSPVGMNVTIDTDTLVENLVITNVGSRDLVLDFPYGFDKGFAQMDGSGDYLDSPYDPSHMEGMTELTIEAWIKRQKDGHVEFVSHHYEQWSFYYNSSNRLGIYKGYDGPSSLYQSFTSEYVVPYDEWVHVAATWKGNTIRFYANGKLVGEFNNAIDKPVPTDDSREFAIGRRANTGDYYHKGGIAEVKIWNVARTKEEIQRYINSPVNGDEPNLIGYWPLHDDYADHSVFGLSVTRRGNTYLSGGDIIKNRYVPVVIDKQLVSLAPGEKDTVIFKFPNTGQSGTYVYTTPILSNIKDSNQIDYELSLSYGSEIPSTPVYFNPVASTGKPYEIVVTDAEIDGTDIQVGDEIGVFDDTLCVGAGIFDGSFNLVITAWEEDGTNPGYVAGNPIHYVIYDNSASLEARVESVDYFVGDSTFGYGTFSSVELFGTIFQVQDIPVLAEQYNLVSFNRLPRYTAANVVFDDIDSLQIAYNDEGYAYIPAYGINSIGNIDFRDAYFIYGSETDTFHYQGTSINPLNWDVNLEAGKWNYVSYLGESPMNVELALADSTKDSIEVVQAFGGGFYRPNPYVNSLGDLQPGQGYMIVLNSSSDIVFNYQTSNGFKSNPTGNDDTSAEYFNVKPTGLPYTILINTSTINGEPLNIGDEIAAYDNGLLVGAEKYKGDDITVLTAWEGDKTYELPGFTANNPIEIKVYNSFTNQLLDAEISPVLSASEKHLYFKGSYYSDLKIAAKDESTAPTDVASNELKPVNTYPNPFEGTVHFTYNLTKASDVKLTITNMLGQVVDVIEVDQQHAGVHVISWHGKNTSDGNVFNYSFMTNEVRTSGTLVRIK